MLAEVDYATITCDYKYEYAIYENVNIYIYIYIYIYHYIFHYIEIIYNF